MLPMTRGDPESIALVWIIQEMQALKAFSIESR